MHGFVEFAWVGEIDDVDVAVGSRNHKKGTHNVETVYALLAGDGGDGVWGAEIPIFYRLVPGAGDEHLGLLLRDVDEAGASDRSVVGGDLRCRGGVAR